MKKLLISIICFISILTTGCQQRYTLDQTLFIDSIGLDYNKETKRYTIYYHIASSKTLLTNSMGGGSSETIYSIGHVEANGIYEGLIITELKFNSDASFKNSLISASLIMLLRLV